MRHWIDSLELVLGIWTTLTIPWLHWYRIIIAMLFLSIWLFLGFFVDTSKVRLRQHCLVVVVFYFLFCFRVLGFLFCLFNIFFIFFKILFSFISIFLYNCVDFGFVFFLKGWVGLHQLKIQAHLILFKGTITCYSCDGEPASACEKKFVTCPSGHVSLLSHRMI